MADKHREASESTLAWKAIETAGSVRFGIVLLNLIVAASMLGMLIRQHNVPGFDSYLSELNPFWRVLFGLLGFFDIYHTWYFYLLLALLALNILFASIERFPKTFRLIRNPNIAPSADWVAARDLHATLELTDAQSEAAGSITEACRRSGFRKVTSTVGDGRTNLFTEKAAWNRLGAYPVHVALLTILLGGLLSSLLGFTGEMSLSKGETSDAIISTIYREGQPGIIYRKLPFSVHCTDLEQKLKDPKGSIEVKNTLDWLTRIEIKDGTVNREAVVSLNHPFDHRGYRFFHSTFLPIGKARSILIRVTPEDGEPRDIRLALNGSTVLADGTKIRFIDFRANLNPDRSTGDENSTSYENPAAILIVTSPEGSDRTAYVFRKTRFTPESSINSVKDLDMRLMDFEPVSETHVLFVQYDPGTEVLYAGFLLLVLSLLAVFLFSHRRIWIAIEDGEGGTVRVTLGGDTNRNHIAFEKQFAEIVSEGRGR